MSWDYPVLSKESASFDINTAADKATFTFANNVRIVACGLVIEGTDTGGATVEFDRRVLAGSDTGRVNAFAASIVVPASNQQGKYLHENKSDLTIELNAGDQIVVEVTAEGVTALQAVAVIEYVLLPDSRLNLADAVLA